MVRIVRRDPARPGAELVRVLPQAGPSARITAPSTALLVVLAAVAALCLREDVAGHGLAAGASLLAIALAGALVLRFGLARPVVRSREAVVRAVREDAPAELPHGRLAELAQVHRAVVLHRGAPGGTRRPPRWFYWPAGAVVAGALAPVLVWSAVVLAAAPPVPVDDPALAAAAAEAAVQAERLGSDLDAGLRALRLAVRNGAAEVERLAGPGGPFSAARIAGRGAGGADGLALDPAPRAGRPVVTATASAPDGTVAVAVFDARALVAGLHRPERRTTVVDAAGRTVLDTGGFLALAPAADEVLAARAAGRPVLAGDVLLSAAPVAALDWTAVVEQPVTTLPQSTGRPAHLVALLAALGALAVGLVHLLWHVLPLRRAARLARALAAGDRSTVIVPERHDDVGAVLMALDVLRRTGGPRC